MVFACLAPLRYGSISALSNAGAKTSYERCGRIVFTSLQRDQQIRRKMVRGQFEACSKTPSIRGMDFHTTEDQGPPIRHGCR